MVKGLGFMGLARNLELECRRTWGFGVAQAGFGKTGKQRRKNPMKIPWC